MGVSNSRPGVPVGSSILHAGTSAPDGYLKENGAAVSRTAYAALFAVIGTTYGAGDGSTTFNLPESRGEFYRNLDDGRGVDTGRAINTAQGSQNLSHAHGVGDPTHRHYRNESNGSEAFIRNDLGGGSSVGAGPYGNQGGYFTGYSATGIWIGADGGTEARPRNVARLACIRYA